MTNKNLFKLLVTMPVIIMIMVSIGCKSTPETEIVYRDREVKVEIPVEVIVPSEATIPLTVNILNSLRRSGDFDIKYFQFFLSNDIMLERDHELEKQDLIDGRAVFEDQYTRRQVSIKKQLPGQALIDEYSSSGINLYLCFEEDDKFLLTFAAGREDSSQFQLQYLHREDIISGTRGSLEYGENLYTLRYTGEIPNLMIRLDVINRTTRNERQAPGRKITTARITDSDKVPFTIDILNRLERSENFSMDRIQFYLNNKITLENISEIRDVSLVRGRAVFANNNTTNIITLEDQLEGISARASIVRNAGEIDLYLLFDTEDNLQMKFSARGEEATNRFYLQFSHHEMHGDSRGTIQYGNQPFRLKFTGGIPYLMLPLSQTGGINTQQHTAPGRWVSPEAARN